MSHIARNLASAPDRPWLSLLADDHVRRIWAWEETEVKRMLGCWVSGLEPSLLFDYAGRLIGLTLVDLPLGADALVVVPAQGGPYPSWR